MEEHKFKIGQKVKVINEYHSFKVGDICEVVSYEGNYNYLRRISDNYNDFMRDDEIKLLIDNSRGFKECFDCSQKIGSPTLCEQCLWVRENYKPEVKPKFEVGDKAIKPIGYRFDCEIVSVFKTTKGDIRIVAENGDGLLHIFNESNLEKIN